MSYTQLKQNAYSIKEGRENQIQRQRIPQGNFQPPCRQRQGDRHKEGFKTDGMADPHTNRATPAIAVLKSLVDVVVNHIAGHRTERQHYGQGAEVQHIHAEAIGHQRHQDNQGEKFKQDCVNDAAE